MVTYTANRTGSILTVMPKATLTLLRLHLQKPVRDVWAVGSPTIFESSLSSIYAFCLRFLSA